MAHLLLTGHPGVGKTTIILAVAHGLADLHPAGFYTQEIRHHGIRQGFRLVTLDGRELVLAHVRHASPKRVSRYGVDVAGFERVLTQLNLPGSVASLIIIDEIGKMECLSTRFVEDVEALLDSRTLVIATVALKGGGFIEAVKRRADCRLITATRENRDDLPQTLMDAVRKA